MQVSALLAGALVLIALATVAVTTSQRAMDRARLAEIAVGLQKSLFENLVDDETRQLLSISQRLAADILAGAPADILAGAPALERGNVAAVVDGAGALVRGLRVEVVDEKGALVSANGPIFRSRPIIDAPLLAQLSRTRTPARGLRQDTPERFVILAAVPLLDDRRVLGALSVAMDARTLLDRLSREMGEPAFLTSPRGRLATGTNRPLWEAVDLVLPRDARRAELLRVGAATYFAAAAIVEDINGGAAGFLVTLRDVSDTAARSERTERIGLVGVIIGASLIIGAVYVLMRQAFQPLEGAIAALGALSRGEFNRPIPIGGAKEIARISEALAVFRRNAQRLSEQDDAIARQRRRQERIIRRELTRLSTLLDEEGRAEIVSDLSAVLNEDGESSDLARLATLLQRMAGRIASQQNRLTDLVEQLKASIATRERLAAIEQELDIARDLQQSFLPKPLPPHPAFGVSGLMESAKEVGGDFFDMFMIDDTRLAFAVADVSGKGVPAAMFMAITRTLLRATALSGRSPGETVAAVNDVLSADNEQMMFVTLFYGVFDSASGTLTTVNAGHNPPYRIGAAVAALPRAKAPALGVMEDLTFPEEVGRLARSEKLFVFTDGVTEAFDPKGEAYGEERLEAILAANADAAPDALCRIVRQHVLAFEDGGDQADDVTCFALEAT